MEMRTYTQEETWYGAVYVQGIIPRMSAQGCEQDHQPCGANTVIDGEITIHYNVDIPECCRQHKLSPINQGRNN